MPSPAFDRGVQLASQLAAAGIAATVDPRAATPPCVLIVPPRKSWDVNCGFTADWSLVAMVPNPANADAWKALDALTEAVRAVLPDVVTADFAAYSVSPDNPPFPAYRIALTEGV